MSQADSENITNPSRRELGSLFFGSAVAVGALIGFSAAPVKDQIAAFKSLHAAFLAANAECDAAEERFGKLPLPAYRFGDTAGGYVTERSGDKIGLFCDVSRENVDDLKWIAANDDLFPAERRAAQRTIALIEAFHAEKVRREDASGLRAAMEHFEEISDRKFDLACDIISREPKSIKDLALQASVARAQFGDEIDFDILINRLIKLAGVEDVTTA